MENYTRIDIISYIKNGIENGTLIPRKAKKFAKILAKQGVVGETVISWSVDELGNEIKEKVDQVKVDELTNQPGWIVTKVDEQGNIIIDKNGHPNQWIIDDSKFKAKYEIDPEIPTLYKAKGGVQIFVQINDNIIFKVGNSDMKVAAFGYLNITDINNVYGISKRDFDDTYRFIDSIENKCPKFVLS